MTSIDRTGANNCFVCGPDNKGGLRLKFRMEGEECRSEYTPAADHIGYDNVVHGGLIYSALDDVMANWLFLQGERAVTARCEIRYRRVAEPGRELQLVSRLESKKGRMVKLSSQAIDAADQEVVAEATATFLVTADSDS
jgi:acyl-coenzyme A thioesterase PaaI-like protein